MTDPRPHRPELLAPAGDRDALCAAVAAGADAVYFGLPHFNARHRAHNFTLQELPEVIAYLHGHNVRGYVTVNTLIFSDELPEAVEYLKTIAAAGADAVIVQDLGLVRLIKRLVPTLAVHGSTQMTLTEPRGVEFVRRLGAERVILARELSVADVTKIAAATPTPLEVFVHGALCVAYSGQCLTSEALGGRSANRGQCAQACRLPYELIVDGRRRDLGDVAYLLSPRDLAAYELVEPLTKAGVVSLKIEGRLKSPQYVAVATQTYRAAVDAAVEGRPFALSPDRERDLAQVYSRGFTPGFLAGVDHQRLVHGRFPKSRGVRVGTVVGVTRRGVVVEAGDADLLRPGDGVVFDQGRPEEPEPGGRVFAVERRSPSRVEVQLGRDFDPSAVRDGDLVWKTDDPALRRRVDQQIAAGRTAPKMPLAVRLGGRPGGELSASVRDADGNEASASWPGPLQRAQRQPLSAESAREQFGRLGDTPFALAELTLDVPEPVLAPRSVLNDLRRRAVAELLARRERRHPVADPDALEHLRGAAQRFGEASLTGPHLYVLVRTLEQLNAVLPRRPELVWCDFEDVRRYREAVALGRAAGVPVGVATLRVVKPGEEGFLRTIAASEPDAVLVRNLAALSFYREHAPDLPLVGDFSLNVANELTAELFFAEGLRRLVPSYDLNWEQFAALLRRSRPGRFEAVAHQHMPMFHNEHCVFAAALSSGKDWRDCGRPCDRHRVELRDRSGAAFPLLADAGCRNTVFNAVAQSAAEYLPRMLALGVRHFRVELLRESAAEVGPLLDLYERVLAGRDDGRAVWRRLRAQNQLGVTRGTLQLI
jgi:U32 family peptidase